MSSFILTVSEDSGIKVLGGTTIDVKLMNLAGPPGPPGQSGAQGNPFVFLDYAPTVNGVQSVALPVIPVNVFVYLDGLLQSPTNNYTVVTNVLTFLAGFNILTTDSVLIVYN